MYKHGDETFGDMLVHPILNLQEHRKRVKTFREDTLKYQNTDVEAGVSEKDEKLKITQEKILLGKLMLFNPQINRTFYLFVPVTYNFYPIFL